LVNQNKMEDEKCAYDYSKELKVLLIISLFLIVLSILSSLIVLITLAFKFIKKKLFQKSRRETLIPKKKPKKLVEHKFFTKLARHSIKILIFLDLLQATFYLPLVFIQTFVPNFDERFSFSYAILQLDCKCFSKNKIS
jgi:hypothetical protein